MANDNLPGLYWNISSKSRAKPEHRLNLPRDLCQMCRRNEPGTKLTFRQLLVRSQTYLTNFAQEKLMNGGAKELWITKASQQ
nr:hypothetical protein BgiMline_020250 [Biomphalaria glabrata]